MLIHVALKVFVGHVVLTLNPQVLDPRVLAGLCSLVELELSSNVLEVLPDEIGCLKKLQVCK